MTKRLTIPEFKEKANLKHNSRYDYSKVKYSNAKTKVIIICPIHGEFLQRPDSHLNGAGCQKCQRDADRLTLVEFINRSSLKHNNKYDYSLVKYINSQTKVIIKCPYHGEFEQTPNGHLMGKGCQKCKHVAIGIRTNSTTEDFIKKATNIHGDKYNYLKVNYINAKSPVIIMCPEHGDFLQKPNHHLSHYGCLKCSIAKQTSKMSDAWLSSLNIETLVTEHRIAEKLRRIVDGYDPMTNTIYQFHGDYFHGNPLKFKGTEYNKLLKMTHGELYEKTCNLDQELRDFGYNLVIMWEYDWLKISNN